MEYTNAIEKIHSFGKFGSKLGLERMTKLMKLLGNPQSNMKIIHVAGTNGKGSVCRYLYTILGEAGYKTGLYTSPYLERFTERMEFDGKEITEEDLADATEKVLSKVEIMLEEGFESPTEFELVTAIAFYYFSKKNMDFLLLEVGLGGIGDSTNVIEKSIISIITSISFDHMNYLGNTLISIAAEKAGIIKEEIPIICNVPEEAPKKVIMDIAKEKNSMFYDASKSMISNIEKHIDYYKFDVQIEEMLYTDLKIQMIGEHQIANAVCSLYAIEVFRKSGIIELMNAKPIYEGLFLAKQTGRFEILKRMPYVIIDGAHNEAGADALAAVMKEHFHGKKILLVTGLLEDKKVDHIIDRFIDIADRIIVTEPDNPRKHNAHALMNKIKQKSEIQCVAIKELKEAIAFAEGEKHKYDAVVYAGSLYLIGGVRRVLNEE